jgi:xylulokinase
MARAERLSSCVLGVDLGTSSCKACVVRADGEVQGQARARYPTHSPHPGWSEQDPADWLTATAKAVAAAVRQARVPRERIAGLALTCAAHIGVLMDERDQPVRRAILWNDQRSTPQVRQLERKAGELILSQSQQAVSSGWTLAHLAWVRQTEPTNWRRLRRVLLSKDFLAFWLCGSRATDPATAVSAQLWDATRQRWSEELCGLIDLPMDALPDVCSATAIIGALQETAARALGLRPGTPVINGSLDTATELLACGITRPGQGMVRLATAGGVQVVVEGPSPHRRRITYPHALGSAWYCQAGTSTCAAAVQWAVERFGGGGRDPWPRWERLAASVPPGSDGVMFHPYLAGERAPYWSADLRGRFTGLSLGHGTGHLARAVYEGAALSIRDAMSVLADARLGRQALAVAGGGTRSAVWLSVLADVLGRPLRVVEGSDSAYGAAMLAMAGLKLGLSLTQRASRRRAVGRRIEPDRRRVELYQRLFERYRAGVR